MSKEQTMVRTDHSFKNGILSIQVHCKIEQIAIIALYDTFEVILQRTMGQKSLPEMIAILRQEGDVESIEVSKFEYDTEKGTSDVH